MLRKLKKIISAILIVCISVITIGCKQEKVKKTEKRNYIVYAVDDLDFKLNAFEEKIKNIDIYNSLFDGLFEKNEKGEIIPVIAESYKVSDDGLDYTITIRDNVYWNDGSKITSEDIVNYFRQVLSYKNKSDSIHELYTIFGAKKYHEGIDDFSCVAMKSVDDRTIKIRMNNKDEDFLSKLSSNKFKIVKKLSDLNSINNNYMNIKYSGAYSIKKINNDNSVELVLNTNYFDKKNNQAEKIIVKKYESNEDKLADMKLGNVDLFKGCPQSELVKLYEENALQVFPKKDTIFLGFNLSDNKISSNLNFRRAIQRALSYSFYTYTGVKEGKYDITKGQIIRDTGQDKIALYTASSIDMDKIKNNYEDNIVVAKNILKNQKDALKINYKLLCEKKYSDVAENIKNNLHDGVNLDVEIEYCDDNNINEAKKKDDYDMFICEYDFLNNNSSDIYKDMLLNSSWQDKDFLKNNKILLKSDMSQNEEQIIKKIIENKIPYISLLFENEVVCKSKKIDYINFYNDGVIKLKDMSITD